MYSNPVASPNPTTLPKPCLDIAMAVYPSELLTMLCACSVRINWYGLPRYTASTFLVMSWFVMSVVVYLSMYSYVKSIPAKDASS